MTGEAGADLLEQHRRALDAAAIHVDVAVGAGVRSVRAACELPEAFRWCGAAPGLLFRYSPLDGAPVEQYRPDEPVDDQKYLWPKGAHLELTVHPAHRDRVGSGRVAIVEGTKQALAAVSAAPGDVLVVGMAGCRGWQRNGLPNPDLVRIVGEGTDVVVFLDADVATNLDVWVAGDELRKAVEALGGNARFVHLPAGKNTGLDDYLASLPPAERPVVFERLMAQAGRLPRRPKAKPPKPVEDPFFDTDGLRVDALWRAVSEGHHLAVDRSGELCLYRDGYYQDAAHWLTAIVADLLGDRWRPAHQRALEEVAKARLHVAGRVIPETTNDGLVNVKNGLLDPATGRLHPHTPKHLSTFQLPVRWVANATCPTFDAWLAEVTAGRGDDLLEATSRVLDTRLHRQRKALFLEGPSRSGKSTYLRLIEAGVGQAAVSAVTLHDLANDKFARAELYGKRLNAAADLSGAHLEDVSIFKQMTGDDVTRAQRKYGQPFKFFNQAMFVFASNEIPTIGEVSRAYLARIRPYTFPHSYEGREDPTIEDRMRGELEGILVRLVEAYQRFEQRGGYLGTSESEDAMDAFARRSDRVRLFLWETTEPSLGTFVNRVELFDAFERWCQVNRRAPLGRHRFFDSVEAAGYRAAKRGGIRGFVGLDLLPEGEWGGREPAPKPGPESAPSDDMDGRDDSAASSGEASDSESAPGGQGRGSSAADARDAKHHVNGSEGQKGHFPPFPSREEEDIGGREGGEERKGIGRECFGPRTAPSAPTEEVLDW